MGETSARARGSRATAATTAPSPGRGRGVRGEGVRHPAALFDRHLLKARPPLGDALRCEPELGAQQQEVVRGTEARVLEQAQRTAPTGVLEAGLQRKHLTHAEREALGDGDA